MNKRNAHLLTGTCSVSMQVLFDDIGPSLIRVDRPDLQLRLILSFLQFLGLPVSRRTSDSTSLNILLDDLSLLEEGPDAERPLTSYDLPTTGISSAGHMTFLNDRRKQAGLCKAGEEFLRNVMEQILPLVPALNRTVVALCWLQYEKLKVKYHIFWIVLNGSMTYTDFKIQLINHFYCSYSNNTNVCNIYTDYILSSMNWP